jgi:hypothetical protein
MGAPPSFVTYQNGEATEQIPVVTEFRLPLIIEPNWELVPNEVLIFTGIPIVDGQIILEIGVHVWEFENWEK